MERTCSKRSESRPGEGVEGGDDDRDESRADDNAEVEDLQLPVAVEAVVDPGEKGAHRQERYPAVVKPGKQIQ